MARVVPLVGEARTVQSMVRKSKKVSKAEVEAAPHDRAEVEVSLQDQNLNSKMKIWVFAD